MGFSRCSTCCGGSELHRLLCYYSTCCSKLIVYDACLVEVGMRCQGGEGTWLPVANECIGYSQVEATLNCYVRPDRFDALPTQPTLLSHGCEAFLVSHQSGVIVEIPGIDKLRELPSFRRCEMLTQPGAVLRPTVDCFTRPGSVQMVHKERASLQHDYDRIRSLERQDMFALHP